MDYFPCRRERLQGEPTCVMRTQSLVSNLLFLNQQKYLSLSSSRSICSAKGEMLLQFLEAWKINESET